MKQFFRFFAVLIMSVFATASSWAVTERTMPAVTPQTFALDVDYYVLNVGTGMWLTKGEAWGTQSVVGTEGMAYQVKDAYALNGTLPEGTYYFYSNEAGGKHWMSRIATDGRANGLTCFSDGTDAHNSEGNANQIAWNLSPAEGNAYFVTIPEGFNQYVEVTQQFLGVSYYHKHGDYGQSNGSTFGVWWDIDITDEENIKDCEWAFITADEYNTVRAEMAVYAASVPVFKAIKDYQEYGYDASEAIAVYENAEATAEALKAAWDKMMPTIKIINAKKVLKKVIAEAANYNVDASEATEILNSSSATVAQLQAAQTTLQAAVDAKKNLKALIEEAEGKGFDVTAEKAVYNDVAATSEEIAAATKSLDLKLASPTHPVEIEGLITNPAPYANIDGWTCTKPDGSAGAPNAFDSGNKDAEFWNLGGYSLSQTVANVPAGVYQLEALAFTRTDMKGYLRVKKAGKVIAETTIATYPSSEVNNRTQANTLFNSGKGVNHLVFYLPEASDIEISLTADNTTGDHWTVWRSFAIQTIGSGAETYLYLAHEMLPETWEDWLSEIGTFAQPYADALYAADDLLKAATTDEQAKAAFEAVYNAVNGFKTNQELVTKLQDNIATLEEEHNALGEDRAGDPEVDPCDALLETANAWIDAIDSEDEEGMAEVTNEALEQWFADWETAFHECTYYRLQQMTAGEEGNCNKLLQNPGFKDKDGNYTTNGWTITGKAPNFFNNFPLVAEVWAANFDASQTIELPVDGAYSLHTHGFYRTHNTAEAWERWVAAGYQETQNLSGENADNTCRAYLYADNLTERFSNTFHNVYTRAQVQALADAYFTQDFMDTYIVGKNNGNDWTKSGGGSLNEDFETCITTNKRTNPYDFSFDQIATADQILSNPDYAGLIPNGVYSAHAVFSSPEYGNDYNMAINFLGRKGQVVKVGVKAENIVGNGWTIFQPFKLTWYGKDVNKLQEVMQKVLDNASALAAEPMQKDTLAALNAGLTAAQDAIAAADGDALLAAYDAINAAYGPAEESVNAYIPLVNKKAELDAAITAYPNAMAETKAAAEALQSEVAAMIAGGTITSDQIPAKIEEMALVIKHLPISDQPGDFTAVIENPMYIVNDAASLAGWSYDATDTATKTVAPNAEKQSVGGVNMGITEGWNGSEYNFNIWQDIDGLPNGYYLVTVQGAFRPFDNPTSVRRMGLASTADVPVTTLDGVNALYAEIADSLTYIYANDETAVMQSLYILPSDERDLAQWADNNGGTGTWWQSGTYKDEVTEEDVEYFVKEIGDEKTYAYIPTSRNAVAYRFGTRHFADEVEEFATGEFFFTNKLSVKVTDGNLRIGVRNRNAAANSWSPHTNWHLYYIGTEGPATNGINELSDNTAKTVKTTVYSIDGRQMNSAARGVNIVKTRDNNGKETVRKVIVK